MRKIKTSRAVGLTLAHDMTKVVPGVYKGARFTRGHVVAEADIPELLSMGKEHVYVMDEENERGVHEEEASVKLAGYIAGENTTFTGPREGKVNIKSTVSGIVKVNVGLLGRINSVEGIAVATVQDLSTTLPGKLVAAAKIVPLYIEAKNLEEVEKLAAAEGKAVEIRPFILKKVAVVVTGSEVCKGLIQDKFVDIMKSKVEPLGASVFSSTIVTDDEDMIAGAVQGMKAEGAELIIVCGGLSVDPDDVTVEGVKRAGARILKYGAPVVPGAMMLMASLGDTPILGAPAGGLFNINVIDVILPRLIAGQSVSRQDIIDLGHGGLCLNCSPCNFPECHFCR